VSAPGFRFTGDATHPSRVDAFRHSIAALGSLPCDILLTTHPGASGMDEKRRARASRPASDPFIDPKACRTYAAHAADLLEARVREEEAAPPPTP